MTETADPGVVHVEIPHDHPGTPHGSRRSYLIGFALSALLTFVPFWLVMGGVIRDFTTVSLVVTALAAIQMVVHMVYFLHMNPRSEGGWTLTALVFTLVLVLIVLSGSLWVLYHLDANMMPGTPDDMRNMP